MNFGLLEQTKGINGSLYLKLLKQKEIKQNECPPSRTVKSDVVYCAIVFTPFPPTECHFTDLSDYWSVTDCQNTPPSSLFLLLYFSLLNFLVTLTFHLSPLIEQNNEPFDLNDSLWTDTHNWYMKRKTLLMEFWEGENPLLVDVAV